MGTSAFDPVALADTRSVRNKITEAGITGDVLAIGDVIRWDPSTDKYVLAKANNQNNGNFVGVVETIETDGFTIVYSGEISLPDSLMTTISGATGAFILYLSDTNAGKLTTVAPSAPGSVIKPVVIMSGTAIDSGGGASGIVDGVVVNTAGDVILGDSSVDISEIQPVGSILAFAGTTSDIPVGWDICDGGFLSVSTYSDLYAALDDGKIYGFIQGCTLTSISNPNSGSQVLTTGNIVGQTISVGKSGTSISILGTILGGTPSADGSIVTGVTIFIDPLANGVRHNLELATNDTAVLGGNFLSYTIQSPTKTQFKKPDLRGRFIVGDSRGITGVQVSGFDSYEVGYYGGEEEHVLTTTEIPIHSHGITLSASYNSTINASFSGSMDAVGSHTHPNVRILRDKSFPSTAGQQDVYVSSSNSILDAMPAAGTHTHTINGTVTISSSNLTPDISGSVLNSGSGNAHTNVPQHMVAIWIIKTRKDSVAKLFKLGPSGGGAIIAKNTAKRWARASSGAGCTIDAAYGTWTVTRLGQGDYRFNHDLISELGTADQNKYIVEATVIKNGSGATQMFLANPYDLGGLTFGVRVYDIIGATHSDGFQYLGLSVYGGGTAL
jgi:microcystin-dependent protein